MANSFFESEHVLANAEVILDVCREEYEDAGHQEEAQAVKGLDVYSLNSARTALLIVQALPEYEGLSDVRQYTLEALKRAVEFLDQPQLRRAS